MFHRPSRSSSHARLRLLTTVFAVLLGVALHGRHPRLHRHHPSTFDSALADAHQGVDAMVRADRMSSLGFGEPGPRLDADSIDSVAVSTVSPTSRSK